MFETRNDAGVGAALGALIGGTIGYAKGGLKGGIVGLAASGIVGGLIAHVLDDRRCQLYKIAQANNLHIESEKISSSEIDVRPGAEQQPSAVGLDVQIQNSADEFEHGSARLGATRQQKRLNNDI